MSDGAIVGLAAIGVTVGLFVLSGVSAFGIWLLSQQYKGIMAELKRIRPLEGRMIVQETLLEQVMDQIGYRPPKHKNIIPLSEETG